MELVEMSEYLLKAIEGVDDMNKEVYEKVNKHISGASKVIDGKNRHLLDLNMAYYERGEVCKAIRELYHAVRTEATENIGDYRLPREINESGKGWICMRVNHLKTNLKFYESEKKNLAYRHNREINQNLRDLGFVA